MASIGGDPTAKIEQLDEIEKDVIGILHAAGQVTKCSAVIIMLIGFTDLVVEFFFIS